MTKENIYQVKWEWDINRIGFDARLLNDSGPNFADVANLYIREKIMVQRQVGSTQVTQSKILL